VIKEYQSEHHFSGDIECCRCNQIYFVEFDKGKTFFSAGNLRRGKRAVQSGINIEVIKLYF